MARVRQIRDRPRAMHGHLWQLCCRIGRTATVACQMVGSHARCHHLPRATGARRGVNAGTAQRAGDGSRAYPANRHRLWIRTRSFVRRWPVQRPIGAASGPVTRTHTLMRKLLGRGSIPCAVRRQTHVFAAGATPVGPGVTLVTPPGEPSESKMPFGHAVAGGKHKLSARQPAPLQALMSAARERNRAH